MKGKHKLKQDATSAKSKFVATSGPSFWLEGVSIVLMCVGANATTNTYIIFKDFSAYNFIAL